MAYRPPDTYNRAYVLFIDDEKREALALHVALKHFESWPSSVEMEGEVTPGVTVPYEDVPPMPDDPKCDRCGARLTEGTALQNTLVAHADFPGDTFDTPGATMSYGGPGKLVRVLKCPKCGYSRTP